MRTFVLFIQGGGEGAHQEDELLAKSLQQTLGSGYEVVYPVMPVESDPDLEIWKARFVQEIRVLKGKIILVGHSLGGYALLKYLSEQNVSERIEGLHLLAAPSWDEDNWNYDSLRLPADLAEKLSSIPRIFLYHNRDDDIVPFRHLSLHAARLPQAVVREGNSGGHQFGNDLLNVANDIKN